MNTLYFSYALEVEKTASITQAADNLFMTQPTLSKAIKDLEANMGFAIFHRTSRGVVPTQKGQVFLDYARKIVAQLDKMDLDFRSRDSAVQTFSLAIPRIHYIARAARDYLCTFDSRKKMELEIRETNSTEVLECVADGRAVIGVFRFRPEEEEAICKRLNEKGLQSMELWQNPFVAVFSKSHPLALKETICMEDLAPYIEIAFGDEPTGNRTAVPDSEDTKRILVYDRSMQFSLLRANPQAYIWTSPLPPSLLASHKLVQRACPGGGEFRDVLISRSGYRLSSLDLAFLDELKKQRDLAVSHMAE